MQLGLVVTLARLGDDRQRAVQNVDSLFELSAGLQPLGQQTQKIRRHHGSPVRQKGGDPLANAGRAAVPVASPRGGPPFEDRSRRKPDREGLLFGERQQGLCESSSLIGLAPEL